MLFHCRAVKLPAVVRQTSHHTAAHRGGHSSADVDPKPSVARCSTRNKKNQNDKDPLGSVPNIVHVDPAEDVIDKTKQVQRRQVACRGKCFAPAQALIHKIEEPKLKACSVVVDTEKVAGNYKPKPKDRPKPKPKSKKIAAESVTPKEKSKENVEPKEQLEKHVEIPKEKPTEVVSKETENGEPKDNIEPKEQSEKHVEIPKEKATEVVSNDTENGEPSYEIEHVAVYVKTVDDVETQDTEDGCTKEEKMKNIHHAFEINRLECVIDKVIMNRLKVDSSTEKIKCLKDILELLGPEFVKVDFTDIMHDETKENDASDNKDIEDQPMKPKKPEKRVTFQLDTADEKHEEEMSQISKDTEELRNLIK